MLKEEIINGRVFVAQTTYYIYQNEEDRKEDKWITSMSDEKKFEENKESARRGNKKVIL